MSVGREDLDVGEEPNVPHYSSHVCVDVGVQVLAKEAFPAERLWPSV